MERSNFKMDRARFKKALIDDNEKTMVDWCEERGFRYSRFCQVIAGRSVPNDKEIDEYSKYMAETSKK